MVDYTRTGYSLHNISHQDQVRDRFNFIEWILFLALVWSSWNLDADKTVQLKKLVSLMNMDDPCVFL